MHKESEATSKASQRVKFGSILSHNLDLHNALEQGFYVDEFGRRHALLGAMPPYLTYTDNSSSTSVKNPDFFGQKSADFYFKTMKLFNENKIFLQREYSRGYVKLKFINHDNVVLYCPPNVRGGSVVGYELSRENSNSENARLTSKNNAQDKALANVDIWHYFVTFTLDKTKQDRFNFKQSYTRISRFLQKRHVKYFLVPERHKDGAWHFHGLCSAELGPLLRNFDPSSRLPKYILARLAKGEKIQFCEAYAQNYGYNVVEPCKNAEACARYMTKYVLKTFDDPNFERVSRRRYFCSTGLKSPQYGSPNRINLNEFEPVRFSTLISKVTLKRRDLDYEYRKQLGSTP